MVTLSCNTLIRCYYSCDDITILYSVYIIYQFTTTLSTLNSQLSFYRDNSVEPDDADETRQNVNELIQNERQKEHYDKIKKMLEQVDYEEDVITKKN